MTPLPLLIDAHLDLGMNAIEWNRDLRKPVAAIREREQGMRDKVDRGNGTVALPELRKGGAGLVVATQIARYVKPDSALPGWNAPEIAWGITQAQLGWYRAMEEQGEMRQITSWAGLEQHLQLWQNDSGTAPSAAHHLQEHATIPQENTKHGQQGTTQQEPDHKSGKPIGYILSLEGADSLVNIDYLHKAYAYGLRACGPAHYGPGRYAYGTGTTEGFTQAGRDLLREMDNLRMILDVTHLTDLGFRQAIELYKGPIWASHHNCRVLVPNQRQLTDDQISILLERDAVIGGVLDAWMLAPDWQRGVDMPQKRGVNLEKLVEHFDHICQLAGNSLHIGIGSDLDGGYGTEQSPYDLDTIADLQHLREILDRRGYSSADIENIFSANWLRFLKKAWA